MPQEDIKGIMDDKSRRRNGRQSPVLHVKSSAYQDASDIFILWLIWARREPPTSSNRVVSFLALYEWTDNLGRITGLYRDCLSRIWPFVINGLIRLLQKWIKHSTNEIMEETAADRLDKLEHGQVTRIPRFDC